MASSLQITGKKRPMPFDEVDTVEWDWNVSIDEENVSIEEENSLPDITFFCEEEPQQNLVIFEMVHRPLAFRSEVLRYDLPRTGRDFMLLHRWPYLDSKRWLSYGLQGSELLRIFDAFPHDLCSSIDHLMKLLGSKYYSSTPALDVSCEIVDNSAPPADFQGPIFDSSVQLGNIWNDDEAHGICVYDFTPHTQERKDAKIDSLFASIRGMHEEEYRTRLARYEHPMQWTDLEFSVFFVIGLRNHLRTESASFCERLVLGSGDSCRAVLVRQEYRNSFDSRGRITRVTYFQSCPCSSMLSHASLCPNRALIAAVGDVHKEDLPRRV